MCIGLADVVLWPIKAKKTYFDNKEGIFTSVLIVIDYFFGYQRSTFNLENNKCICQGSFFVYNVTGSTYSRFFFSSYVYLKAISKTLKGTVKPQFVSELTILLNLQISKFYASLHKEKNWNYKISNTSPYVGKLTLV